MNIAYVILYFLIFTHTCNAWWGSSNTYPNCLKDQAGIHELTHEGLTALTQSSLNAHDKCGNTAIMYAAALEDLATLILLIKAEANLDLQNQEGNTALHISALLKKLEAAKVLVNAKADPNLQNNKGQTPLHIAINEKVIDLIPLLISHGAHLAIAEKDHEGKTPYDLALALNDPKILEIVENLKLMEKSREGEILAELKGKHLTVFQRHPKITLAAVAVAAWLTIGFHLMAYLVSQEGFGASFGVAALFGVLLMGGPIGWLALCAQLFLTPPLYLVNKIREKLNYREFGYLDWWRLLLRDFPN